MQKIIPTPLMLMLFYDNISHVARLGLMSWANPDEGTDIIIYYKLVNDF